MPMLFLLSKLMRSEQGPRAALPILLTTFVFCAGPVSAQDTIQEGDQSIQSGQSGQSGQAGPAGLAKTGIDASLPIEIAADSLEIQQESNTAIFTGQVDAVQGDLHLRADHLQVFYHAGGNGQGMTSAGGTQQSGISRLDAKGNVFLSSPGETAQGDSGIYDVDNRTIELLGNVVLTSGKTVLRGTRLVMDLNVGKSRIESSGSGQRVRGVFVPQNGSQ